MTHTPGPWVWTDGNKPIDIATYVSPGYYDNPQLMGPDNADIIGCDEYWTLGPYSNQQQMKANARLIASAPQLLEALRALTDEADMAAQVCGTPTFGDAIDNATAAIKAAEG